MLKDTLERLTKVTVNCRPDMHEQKNVSAVVTGYQLDNAMGDDPCHNCGEFTVGISRDGGDSHQWFNLADVIALARMARL